MKRFLIFILLACTISFTLNAQQTSDKKFTWGYKIGVNRSTLREDDNTEYNWKNGLAAGLFFVVRLKNKLSLQPEALYSSMGAKPVANGGGSLRLNYFSLPILAKYNISNTFAVMAGPQMDMLIQAKFKNNNNQFFKLTDNYNESSFTLTGGAEYWPGQCVGLSARYMYGINDVIAGAGDSKNHGFQLMAAIKF